MTWFEYTGAEFMASPPVPETVKEGNIFFYNAQNQGHPQTMWMWRKKKDTNFSEWVVVEPGEPCPQAPLSHVLSIASGAPSWIARKSKKRYEMGNR